MSDEFAPPSPPAAARMPTYVVILLVVGGLIVGVLVFCALKALYAKRRRSRTAPADGDARPLAPGRMLTRSFTSKALHAASAFMDGTKLAVKGIGSGASTAVGAASAVSAAIKTAVVWDERAALDAEATAAVEQQLDKYMELVKCVRLFAEMGESEIEAAAREVQVRHFKEGEVIYDEGDMGHECWVLEEGKCYASKYVWSMSQSNVKEWKETRAYKPGKFGSYFGERGLLRTEPRNLRITCRTDVKAVRISAETYVTCARISEKKEELIRGIELFAQMTDEQVGKLGQVMWKRRFEDGDSLLTQGAPAAGFYIIESGEAIATKRDVEVERYTAGAIVGEEVLSSKGACAKSVRHATASEPSRPHPLSLSRCPLALQVRASGELVGFAITRAEFEERLGPLHKLQAEQFAADPRKLISDFYKAGDKSGPSGVLAARGGAAAAEGTPQTDWFAVYRPCSRDSIAKMLGTVAVGKGLNIKGKSAKKNRLSGFVPFLQVREPHLNA